MSELQRPENWIIDLLRKHPALLVSGLYVVASTIGMLYSWDYLRLFGINVFNYAQIGEMDGFTNSIGLFFTAAALNDLNGTLEVESKPGSGSTFTIRVPETISATKNLLVY